MTAVKKPSDREYLKNELEKRLQLSLRGKKKGLKSTRFERGRK